jgi:hypothetical protein
MKSLILCLALGGLGLAGGAAAQTSTATTATPPNTIVTAPAAKPKQGQRVCHIRIRSGSHFTDQVCKTPAEWAAMETPYDTEAELGVPGNKVSTGRNFNRGDPGGAGPPR